MTAAAAAAAASSMAPKHSVSRFQRCYSDGSQSSPNMRRKQLGSSASQKVSYMYLVALGRFPKTWDLTQNNLL